MLKDSRPPQHIAFSFSHILLKLLDQDTRFELAPPAWKAGMLAADTNPGNKTAEHPIGTPSPCGTSIVYLLAEFEPLTMAAWSRWSDSNRHGLGPGDFLTTLCYHSRIMRCSLDSVFTISYSDLGSWCIVSTHNLFSTIFTSIRICLCVTVGTQQFKIFKNIIVCVSIFMMYF